MGGLLSTAAPSSPPPPPPSVVLVPPMFQRDIRGMSRFCRSSYDYLGSRKQLARLLSDHLGSDLRGALLLSPPDDQRLSVRAKLRRAGGSMVLRWQPTSAAAIHTFLEMAASLDSPGDASVRGSYLHPASGLGAFAVLPLAEHLSGEAPQVGVRYSSPDVAGGAILAPQEGRLDRLWLASRLHSGFTLGLQLSPRLPVSDLLPPYAASSFTSPSAPPSGAGDPPGGAGDGAAGAGGGLLGGTALAGAAARLVSAAPWLRSRSSLLLAYSPAPSAGAQGGSFTACVELAEGRALSFSFFQHIAATRQVVNPFEEDEVVGITNYLDIGLQLTTSLGQAGEAGESKPDGAAAQQHRHWPSKGGERQAERPASFNLAASWQINKNWLIKARAGSESAAAAIGVRAWHAVSAYVTASIAIDYATKRPRYGAELCIENFGPLRYERGADDVASGRALLQRHEASPQDLANYAGRGVLVRRASGSNGGSGGGRSAGALEEERRRVAALL